MQEVISLLASFIQSQMELLLILNSIFLLEFKKCFGRIINSNIIFALMKLKELKFNIQWIKMLKKISYYEYIASFCFQIDKKNFFFIINFYL